jgi:hypothetical protein
MLIKNNSHTGVGADTSSTMGYIINPPLILIEISRAYISIGINAI